MVESGTEVCMYCHISLEIRYVKFLYGIINTKKFFFSIVKYEELKRGKKSILPKTKPLMNVGLNLILQSNTMEHFDFL